MSTDFTRHLGPVTCAAAVPGSPLAVTSGYDGAVAVFDFNTRKAELLGYHRHLVNHVAVNPEGTKAASSSSDYEVRIWDLKSRCLDRVLRGHSDDVDCFTFASGNRGVSSGQDKRVIIWDLETGAILRIIHEHEKDVISVVFNNGMIFSSGDDMTVRHICKARPGARGQSCGRSSRGRRPLRFSGACSSQNPSMVRRNFGRRCPCQMKVCLG